jgi:phosphomannomutase
LNISGEKIKFGTDGWRGIIAEEFTFRNLGRLAVRFSEYLAGGGKNVCIGYDNRFLSPEYAGFLGAVLSRAGISVDLSDSAVTTPVVSHRTNRKGYDLGIMISASHNPSFYNGIKIKENYGGSARDEVVGKIIKDLDAAEYNGPTWDLTYEGNPLNWQEDYQAELKEVIPSGGLKVICDYMHGSAYPCFSRILEEKGYAEKSLRSSRDPLFGGSNPEPKYTTLGALMETVRAEGADIGFAFDGDGDRIAVTDGKGRFLSSQIILALLAYDLLKDGKNGSIVKTVAGTYLVDRLAGEYGADVEVVPIGFKNICPAILRGGVIVAGEESGGIGFGDYLPERDALYTASRIVRMVAEKQKTLGELWDELSEKYGSSVYLREDFHYKADYDRSAVIKKVKDGLAGKEFPFKVESVSEMDGIKITMEEGRWLLIRPSGTEPVIRIYAETEEEELTKRIINIGKELLA